jgi:hypothetical protein
MMRFPNVHGYSLFTTYRVGDPVDGGRHHVELWTQPANRWMMARLYHWYDMRVYRLPGFRALERWLESRHADDDLYVPVSCQQDIRCDHLSRKGRRTLATVEISREVYEQLDDMPT